MQVDISDEIIDRIKDSSVGLLLRNENKGAQVMGSGILAAIEGRKGILTCGHVAEIYEKATEIGLVRFRDRYEQRQIVRLADANTLILESGAKWTQKGADLAFTLLSPEVASSIEARGGVFRNLEKNKLALEAKKPEELCIDSMMGLVEEKSEKPFISEDKIVSVIHGILHTGQVTKQENGVLELKAMDYNIDKLPKDFGGMSGSGLWRVYYVIEDGKPKITDVVLIGIASWQIDHSNLACQGWDRIDQALIPLVRQELGI